MYLGMLRQTTFDSQLVHELHYQVSTSRSALHEDCFGQPDTDCSIHGDVVAPVLVDHDGDRLVGIVPCLPGSNPHVESGLVEIRYHFVLTNQLCQFHREVENQRPFHSKRLLVSVVSEQVMHPVLPVKVSQHLPAYFDAFSGFQKSTAIFQTVLCPVTQSLLTQQKILHLALQLRFGDSMLSVVDASVVPGPVVYQPASQHTVHSHGRSSNALANLLVAHTGSGGVDGVSKTQKGHPLHFQVRDIVVSPLLLPYLLDTSLAFSLRPWHELLTQTNKLLLLWLLVLKPVGWL